MRDFAAVEWRRAQRTLASARQLASSDPDSAASRAYYAAFQGLTALFALRGQFFSKHAAVRSALHRELINRGQLAPELGRAYDFLLDLRETGDYGGLAQVAQSDAEQAIEKATAILEAIARLCPDLAKDGSVDGERQQ